jgi:transposase
MATAKLPELVLGEDEARTLEQWARRPTTAQALALRSRIVLRCAEGDGSSSNTVVAEELNVQRGTVAKWRSRFIADRLDGLLDEPRPGRPRTISDDQVEAVIVKTLESAPKDATHWSTRSMAAEVGMNPVRGLADLACLRLAAAPAGLLEAVEGPPVRGQGQGRRRPLPQPARAGRGAVRGRVGSG